MTPTPGAPTAAPPPSPGAIVRVVLRMERWFLVAVMLLASGAFVLLLSGEYDPTLPENDVTVTRLLWIAAYAVSGLAVAVRYRLAFAVQRRDLLLLLLLALPFLSVGWSSAPQLSLTRAVALLGTWLIALHLALALSLDEQLDLLRRVLIVALLASVALALLVPAIGLDTWQPNLPWRGAFATKNGLGRACALAAGLAITTLPTRRARWANWGLLLGAGAVVWLADSRTGQLVFALMLAIPLLVRAWTRGDGRLRVFAVVVFVPLLLAFGIAIGLVVDTAATALGRDLTLTGRTTLWALLLPSALARPWLGYGYTTFWTGPNAPATDLWVALGWVVPHGHNGFLDLWLQLGAVGVAAFVVHLILTASRSLRLARRLSQPTAVWPAVYLSFLIVYNFTESIVLVNNNLFWILYLGVAYTLARHRVPAS